MEQDRSSQAFMRLVEIMHVLRGPQGCPWDAEQTPESLCAYMIEETCEAVEAIEAGGSAAACEELGDMLLQVVFQAEIFRERRRFDIADVCQGIADKLVRRHPHVFDGLVLSDMDQLLANWDRIKAQEKSATPPSSLPTDGVPPLLPALARATKVLQRASRQGLQLPPQPTLPPADARQLGEQLLGLCRWAMEQQVDAEQALRGALRDWLEPSGVDPEKEK